MLQHKYLKSHGNVVTFVTSLKLFHFYSMYAKNLDCHHIHISRNMHDFNDAGLFAIPLGLHYFWQLNKEKQ